MTPGDTRGLRRLGEVLDTIHRESFRHALYISGKSASWTSDTPCAVLDPHEMDDDEDPPFARSAGLCRVLNVDQVQDIVENLRQQDAGGTEAELVRALVFYFQRDAFITFER